MSNSFRLIKATPLPSVYGGDAASGLVTDGIIKSQVEPFFGCGRNTGCFIWL